MLYVAAATAVPKVDKVTPTGISLHTRVELLLPTGSGLMVAVMVKSLPRQPAALMGVIVYTTFTGTRPMLRQASSAISLAALPFPALLVPALWIRPFGLTTILNVVAATEPPLVVIFTPNTWSLQNEEVLLAPTGSGRMVAVTVKGLPGQPAALTGVTV